MRGAAGKRRFQNGILGIIAGGEEKPGQRQRSHGHQREGDRDMATQAAIEAHVLFMVHGMDDRAGAEEQQRLEKGVGEQVEHRRAIGPRAGGKEHVAELRTGRIGDDALDIGLHQRHRGGEQGGGSADIGDDGLRRQAGFEHRRQAADHEDAGGNHGRGMDQRRHRRRAFHCIGQPGVQAQLRRFAHRADEQQQADRRHHVEARAEEGEGCTCLAAHGRQNGVDRDGAEHHEGRENAERKAEITHPIDHECLDRGGVGAGLGVPETDEQIGSEADPFPAHEHLDEVIGGHQHQHGEGEQRQIGEEA